jgi:leucyl/phenylalanyl-tRNA--protein transferase
MPTLDAETLIRAYASGHFPMALDEDRFFFKGGDGDDGDDGDDVDGVDDGDSERRRKRSRIGWFSPDPRGVIPLDEFHIPHGLKRALRKERFEIRIDEDFPAVIAACGDRDETWISAEICEAYTELHETGFAHSVESWQGDELVGGLYGVSLGGAFFGESMFSRATDASKVALVALVERMRGRGFTLLDTQWTNPHLEQFGCREIPRDLYMRQLNEALLISASFVD